METLLLFCTILGRLQEIQGIYFVPGQVRLDMPGALHHIMAGTVPSEVWAHWFSVQLPF